MISLLIVACNEEHRLRECVESAIDVVDEVVIVVQRSTDDTLRVARGLADKIIEHPCHGFCEASRVDGLAACSHPWVLNLDADERLTPDGAAILPALTSNGKDFFSLRRITTVGDKLLEDAAHARLFRRDRVTAKPLLHTQFEPLPGARPQAITHIVMIDHRKTWAEQKADDGRYALIGQAIDPRGFWRDGEGHCFDESLADALASFFPPHASVLDLGCGRGDYVRHLRERDIACIGVDGNPMTPLFNPTCITADLTKPLLMPSADWILCLEVGEHIPTQYSDQLFRNISLHATKGAIVSWAIPNQGGKGHVNERPNEWVEKEMFRNWFVRDKGKESQFRAAATLEWFKNSLMFYFR